MMYLADLQQRRVFRCSAAVARQRELERRSSELMFDLEQPAIGGTFFEEECALIAGCLPSSWRAMVSRHGAPPSRGFCSETGRRVWDAPEVLRWQASRPGSGNWSRGHARSQPSTRLRAYALGNEPAWRLPTPRVRTRASRPRRRPWLTPRVPSLSSRVASNTEE
jgi:hypothetical protein